MAKRADYVKAFGRQKRQEEVEAWDMFILQKSRR